MSDLNTDGLEAGTAEVQETAKVSKEEKLQAKNANRAKGVEALREFGVSENLAKVLDSGAVEAWEVLKDDEAGKEAKDEAKKNLIESFGGVDELKSFCNSETGEMAEEIEKFQNIGLALSTLTTIRHFYAPRKGSGKRKSKKTQPININNELYQVNSAYLAEIAGKSREEKVELLLAHADTKKEEVTEL